MTRKDIAENLNRIANGLKYVGEGVRDIQTPAEKKLFTLRLQNNARELNRLAQNVSYLLGGD